MKGEGVEDELDEVAGILEMAMLGLGAVRGLADDVQPGGYGGHSIKHFRAALFAALNQFATLLRKVGKG